jgi:phosphoserine phosphatase
MHSIAVLVGRPDHGIPDGVARAAAEITRSEANWLSRGLALDLPAPAGDHAPIEAALRAAIGIEPIDVAVIPAEGRRKSLLIADMDSTIIGCECIDELADFAGVKAEVSDITERAMRGELDFPAALRRRVALLSGLKLAMLQRTYDERVRLNPGARILVRTMRANGAVTALVSGGFTFFSSRVAEAAGFEISRANILLEQGDTLTGTVAEPIVGREAKLAMLNELKLSRGIADTATLAIGDGANDLAMIEAAGLGVAYRAKPIVAAAARARIVHADLTALLYFQGYDDSAFIRD